MANPVVFFDVFTEQPGKIETAKCKKKYRQSSMVKLQEMTKQFVAYLWEGYK